MADIDKKESFTNVEIITLPDCDISCFARWSSLFARFYLFQFISIELVTKRNRYICAEAYHQVLGDRLLICVRIFLMFQMIDIGSLLMPISKTNKAFGLDKISARLLSG